ncbi:hypothetical protein GUJ93_ZPchr0014g47279 [Zizania palustris]|uniref:RING-type domain-containing protein n=1 Tax=Zizania palustris TaxID=103762 RepID=A0A8J5W0M8_ZIZPA|nr:hypothetical protein GUJ93_ZPchr0014g47279 [Zizania palustris]KAG8082651.1 hypothetical protein GUJ93_ZPchr0014g47279 [Zizania palustris]KAG8082652.1 hypothetical protein GUJ93_ZPchr0014g47279 [Zizania palustris]KAG8082653.1 hypothetical protein GUJ93_ZPchr0014g47279 [Zizania palustris]
MVDITSDNIFEVPDTPDRIQQSACPVSSPAARRGITKAAGNPLPPRRNIFKTRDNSTLGQSIRGGSASSVAPMTLDINDIFRQAELARSLPAAEDREAISFSLKSDRTAGTSVENEKGPEKLGFDRSRIISNNISYRGTGGRDHDCQIKKGEVSQQDANCCNADFLGVGSGLPTITVGKPHNRMEIITFNKGKEVPVADVCSGSSSREDKGNEITDKYTSGLSNVKPHVPQRHVGQRKLVMNGCISPSNRPKTSLKVDGKQEMCSTSRLLHNPNVQVDAFEKGNVIDLTDNSPPTRQDNTTSDTEKRAGRKLVTVRAGETLIPLAANKVSNSNFSEGNMNKGKEISHDVMGAKQSREVYVRRVCPRSMGNSSSVANNDHTGIGSEQGFRTTHNTTKLPVSHSGKMTSSCRREPGSSGQSIRNHEAAAGDNNSSIDGTTTMQTTRTLRISKKKRNHTSISYPGESSHSVGQSMVSQLASLNSTDARSHTIHYHDIPVVDIDDVFSPEVRPSSSGSGCSNRSSVDPNIREQLEADEVLARQLQEQLYNETPDVPTEEIDAIVARSLQHEEDAQRASRTVRRFQNNMRTPWMHSNASQRASRIRFALNSRRSYEGVVSRYPVPVEHRQHTQPNIDLNDYDALIALDENNHQHAGASESQINNLPQSVVQTNSIEEPCAVCLENPSVGDTIRHLPCFHKFHKECIDEWLRRKKLCPVCKSRIT